ncbi:MAG: putative oligopeptide transport system permease protein appB [Rhodospirillales bacterium]|nr:putative oligopeptide transport system permease protein appB [Rhodospirillales bacterium]
MSRFFLDRLLQSLVVLAAMSFLIYWLIGLMPGDPIDLMISSDPRLTPEDAKRLRGLFGLDRSIYERYWAWITTALSGDLGFSRLYARPVLDVMIPALGNTALLMGTSFILALLIALPAGIVAAAKQYSRVDYAINFAAFAGISLPSFWLALLMIAVFSVWLGILPAGGLPEIAGGGVWESARYLALPVATVTLVTIGDYIRYMRSEMIQTLRHDYIRTARAKGASPARVVMVHALRNALIPVVTIMALDFGFLFSGALTVEIIFSYPGMGRLIFDSIMGNDFNLALVALLFATALTLIGNLLADLAYGWLDPRITLT